MKEITRTTRRTGGGSYSYRWYATGPTADQQNATAPAARYLLNQLLADQQR